MSNFCEKVKCDYINRDNSCSLIKTIRGYECGGFWQGMCSFVNLNGKYNYGIYDGDLRTFMWVRNIEKAVKEEFPNENKN